MNALDKNTAITRGETMAAQLLASASIQAVIGMVANNADKKQILLGMTAFVDDTLNMSGPNKDDPNDEFHTQVRETARLHATHTLDAIMRGLK